MADMDGKRQSALYRKKYRLKTINSATLSEALKEQGYTIIEFNGIHDKGAVFELIDALQLKSMVSQSRCFTYQDENYRLVFLHEDLNDEERTIVLAHEVGHIWYRHMRQGNVIGTDVVQEYEANEFAHYLLLGRTRNRRKRFLIAAVCIDWHKLILYLNKVFFLFCHMACPPFSEILMVSQNVRSGGERQRGLALVRPLNRLVGTNCKISRKYVERKKSALRS